MTRRWQPQTGRILSVVCVLGLLGGLPLVEAAPRRKTPTPGATQPARRAAPRAAALPTLFGDLTGDGRVELADVLCVLGAYSLPSGKATPCH